MGAAAPAPSIDATALAPLSTYAESGVPVSDPSNCAENTAAHIFCILNPSLAEGCPP